MMATKFKLRFKYGEMFKRYIFKIFFHTKLFPLCEWAPFITNTNNKMLTIHVYLRYSNDVQYDIHIFILMSIMMFQVSLSVFFPHALCVLYRLLQGSLSFSYKLCLMYFSSYCVLLCTCICTLFPLSFFVQYFLQYFL